MANPHFAMKMSLITLYQLQFCALFSEAWCARVHLCREEQTVPLPPGCNEKKMNRGWNLKCHYRKLVGYQTVFATAVTELSSVQKQNPQSPETARGSIFRCLLAVLGTPVTVSQLPMDLQPWTSLAITWLIHRQCGLTLIYVTLVQFLTL